MWEATKKNIIYFGIKTSKQQCENDIKRTTGITKIILEVLYGSTVDIIKQIWLIQKNNPSTVDELKLSTHHQTNLTYTGEKNPSTRKVVNELELWIVERCISTDNKHLKKKKKTRFDIAIIFHSTILQLEEFFIHGTCDNFENKKKSIRLMGQSKRTASYTDQLMGPDNNSGRSCDESRCSKLNDERDETRIRCK